MQYWKLWICGKQTDIYFQLCFETVFFNWKSPVFYVRQIFSTLLPLKLFCNWISPVFYVKMMDSQWKYGRPQISFIYMILMAIQSRDDKKATTQDIIKYIMDKYPYYRNLDKRWHNTLRFTLSKNDCFVKHLPNYLLDSLTKPYWTLHKVSHNMFDQGSVRKRKRVFKNAATSDVSTSPTSDHMNRHGQNKTPAELQLNNIARTSEVDEPSKPQTQGESLNKFDQGSVKKRKRKRWEFKRRNVSTQTQGESLNGQDDNNVTFINKGSVAWIGENQDLESSGAFGFSSCAAPSPTLQDPCPNNTCYPAPYQLTTNNSFMFPENTPAISPLPLDSHHACDGFHVNNPFVTIQSDPFPMSTVMPATTMPATMPAISLPPQDHTFHRSDQHLNKIDGPNKPQTQEKILNEQVFRDLPWQSIHNPFIQNAPAPYPIPEPISEFRLPETPGNNP